MDRRYHEREASKFDRSGMAYVHAEYKGGDDNELCVAGDGMAIMRIAERMLARLSALTSNEFDDTIEAVKQIHDIMIEPGA